jgi:hypothetical protein
MTEETTPTIHPAELTNDAPTCAIDTNKKIITEESGEHKKWFEEAAKVTTDSLGDFVKHLVNDYHHDFGTIVHAIAAGVGATISAMNNSEEGGLTGFQASCLMWEILQKEFQIEWPVRLIKYENMLFPVYEKQFNSIPYEIWVWLRERAKYLIENEDGLADSVKQHMKSISDGVVPFGYKVVNDE